MAIDSTPETQAKKPYLYGTLAALALLFVYLFVLTLANSFSHAIDQFLDLWYWMVPLLIGFGIQIGLYTHIKIGFRSGAGATSSVAAAGGVSTTSMIACCAHHVTDVIPLLGVSAAAVFLNQYQNLFLLIGILSNLIGIVLMLRIIQKGMLYAPGGFLAKLVQVDMHNMLIVTSTLSVIVVLLALFFI